MAVLGKGSAVRCNPGGLNLSQIPSAPAQFIAPKCATRQMGYLGVRREWMYFQLGWNRSNNPAMRGRGASVAGNQCHVGRMGTYLGRYC